MGWSDYHTDWSSEEALITGDEFKQLEALTLAVNERLSLLGISELSISRLTSVKDKINLLTAVIKQLIPRYGRIINNNEFKIWKESELKNYGTRPNGTLKGLGYFGEIYMTTGEYDFCTEISIEVDGILCPALVPTLTDDEIKHLLAGGSPFEGDIQRKAAAYAAQRIAQNLNPFADDGEQSQRAWMPGFCSPLVTTAKWIKLMYDVVNQLLIGSMEYNLSGIKYIGYSWGYGSIESAVESAISNSTSSNTQNLNLTHFSEWIAQYNEAAVISSNNILNIAVPIKLRGTSQKIYVTGEVFPYGIFNAGSSGLNTGKQLLFNEYAITFPSASFAQLNIPGEANNNFPKYPISGQGEVPGQVGNFTGYSLSINAYAIKGDFEFISGS